MFGAIHIMVAGYGESTLIDFATDCLLQWQGKILPEHFVFMPQPLVGQVPREKQQIWNETLLLTFFYVGQDVVEHLTRRVVVLAYVEV